ncbi:QueT transporter family protein [Bombilactobacillus folatiphilus]|uniref:QueT transporter family protein n=1 Tax=Bombilactobacillus folatiphilus TaxID=2923362 RepID=A0ABY4PBC4_9LACO|nr:QueT transporter family protein [Bombilactobacillus folatiphilus]UQS82915.1 QueT transporter family protein [Bombilactobacillus folatiphilus]
MKNWALPGIIAALYAVLSVVLAPWSFGVVQFRLSEMFNHLAAFNKRYILALVLGCAIANMFSPLGIMDVFFGTLGTLIGTSLTWYFGHKVSNKLFKYVIATIMQLPGTGLVALELVLVDHVPFWLTWGSVALGEIVSMIIGAVIINLLTLRIDFTKGEVKK